GLLISFAYATKQMLEASKQPIGNIDPMSIKEAFKNMLDTGIPVDKRQLAYVVKYGNGIQYQLGYKGFIHRIKEIFPNSVVKAELVYQGDNFKVTKIDGQAKFVHEVKNPFATKKEIAGAYAYIEYVENGKLTSFIETMNVAEINQIKGCAKTAKVWDAWYGEMAKKAVIRRLCKTLFVGNPILQKLEEVDNNNYEFKTEPVKIEYDKVTPMPEEIHENKADVKEEKKEEEPTVVEEVPAEEQIDESSADNIFTLKSFQVKKGIGKTGKPYAFYILTMDDGTTVRTFDKKDYMEGQTVELVEWDTQNQQCKSVNIL
ncbi:MAG: recombinase RecT, partial [Elusimicrobia bacterium]|nr:recombinase RecT [Elusimicrobiota bacterium]